MSDNRNIRSGNGNRGRSGSQRHTDKKKCYPKKKEFKKRKERYTKEIFITIFRIQKTRKSSRSNLGEMTRKKCMYLFMAIHPIMNAS